MCVCVFVCEQLRFALSNFQVCDTVLLTIVTMLYIRSSGLIHLITGSLYLSYKLVGFDQHSTFFHTLALGDHQSTLCFYEFGFFSFHV